MTTWNYRVCREQTEDGPWYTIREVYYDAEGNIQAWSVDPSAPASESVHEMIVELEHMTEAIGRGVLDLETKETLS